MPQELLLYVLLAAGGGLLVGFATGRYTSGGAKRVREVEARLESTAKDRERAVAETAAAREATARVQTELDGYRGRVTEHFTGTSELLRDLTEQYRTVYDHLAGGANELCPQGFVGLEEALRHETLSAGDEAGDSGSTASEPPDDPK